MLVYRTYRTIAKKVFWEFDSIIMQNLSDILPLFCTPTWSSHHVGETFGGILNFIYRLGAGLRHFKLSYIAHAYERAEKSLSDAHALRE